MRSSDDKRYIELAQFARNLILKEAVVGGSTPTQIATVYLDVLRSWFQIEDDKKLAEYRDNARRVFGETLFAKGVELLQKTAKKGRELGIDLENEVNAWVTPVLKEVTSLVEQEWRRELS